MTYRFEKAGLKILMGVDPTAWATVQVFRDGDKWCALYGRNIQEGTIGFGDTPEQACAAFDADRSKRYKDTP